MSSFLWTALSVGKDTEFGFEAPHPEKADKKVWINTAKYGYEMVINMMTAALKQFDLAPVDMVLVFEGMHSKAPRRRIESSYKEGDSHAPESYPEFEALRAKMLDTWLALGATAVQQDHVEGDDVLAYLAAHTEQDLVIATGDRDLTILNGRNAHGATIRVRYNQEPIGQNPYGPWDLRLISVYKALVGDSGDKIKGVVGFGPKKWEEMLIAYGEEGLFEVDRLLRETGRLGDLHAQVEEDKNIKLICEQEAQCYRSFQLGLLHPEWVNTMVNPLQWKAGMVKDAPAQRDERLQQWHQRKTLVTAKTIEQWAEPLLALVQESPFVAFDIETSTPPESDDWLAEQSKADEDGDLGVDVYGSKLTGFSLTMGRNLQHTFYFSVDHADTQNITMGEARFLIEMPAMFGKRLVIQNFSFEASVCYNAFAEHWLDNGYHGFLPDMDDTKLMFSYVDENSPLGLKRRSKEVLGYEQESFAEVTLLKAPSYAWDATSRGHVVRTYEAPDQHGQVVDGEMQYALTEWQDRRHKMNELPAAHVFSYGCDDTICTAAHYVYCRLIMELEHTWKVYREVEIDAAYQHAVNFECGIKISVEKVNELSKDDDVVYEDAWKIVRQYLVDNEYEGTVPPVFGAPLETADVKMAFEIWTGKKLDTLVRIRQKLLTFITEVAEEPTFALMVASVYKAEGTENEAHAYKWFNDELAKRFKGEPDNPIGSPKKMAVLMYEIMKLPIRVRNKATDKMRNAGVFEGNAKTDVLAMEYALQMDAAPEIKGVLEAMKLMGMVRTRRSLYYTKYANFEHWKDGMVRPQHNQCAANTRRATTAKPNTTQLPKHQKIEGQPARFREVVVPHKRGAVVVSMDFEAQELKVIAHFSKDGNLVACYVGTSLKDVHSLTGLGIFQYKTKKRGIQEISYEEFEAIRKAQDKSNPFTQFVKEDRNLGKKTNFTTEFGAMAPKVAQTLLVSEEDAQAFIDAREAMFPGVKTWKEGLIVDAKDKGYVRSMMGAMRHLRPMLISGNNYEASKAERQAVNFMVQGSAAEQTKLAEGRMWKDNLFLDFDANCYGPIHDEVVASVLIEDLPVFIPRMHRCMVGHFANMSIPITSSISFGPDFYRQVEIGAEPTLDAIKGGLEELKKEYYQ